MLVFKTKCRLTHQNIENIFKKILFCTICYSPKALVDLDKAKLIYWSTGKRA